MSRSCSHILITVTCVFESLLIWMHPLETSAFCLSFLLHFHPGSHTHPVWDTQGHLYKSICNLAAPWQTSDFGPEIQTGEELPAQIIGAHLVTILVSYLTVPFLNHQRCTSEIRANEDPSPSPFKLSSTPSENICLEVSCVALFILQLPATLEHWDQQDLLHWSKHFQKHRPTFTT